MHRASHIATQHAAHAAAHARNIYGEAENANISTPMPGGKQDQNENGLSLDVDPLERLR